MLDRLQTRGPFEVFHGRTLEVAIAETSSKFPEELQKNKAALGCHERIALGLKGAAERGGKPQLRLRIPMEDGGELLVIQVGRQLLPMTVRRLDWDNTAIELFPPASAGELDLEAGKKSGVSGLYGKKSDKLDRMAVVRGQGPATHLVIKGADPISTLPYAWALYEVAASLIRRAVAEVPAKDRAHEVDVPRQARKTSDALLIEALLGGRWDGCRPSSGPALAHELLGAFSYRGRTVAVTSTKGAGEGIRVWVEAAKDDWRLLPAPKDKSWPEDGATPVLAGDQLHLFGGIRDGKVLESHFAIDLSQIDDPDPGMFRKLGDLGTPVAWAAAIFEGRDAFIGGGVAGYMVKAGDKRERERIMRQGFALLGNRGLRDRAPAPGDLTRSAALAHGGCLFFAPGIARDGKVRLYDNTQDGAWLTLPKLPLDVGLGQLFIVDRTLYYAGGFTADGPSSAIFSVDLGQPNPAWVDAGSSPYCAGLARLLERNGQLQSLMVRPDASKCFTIAAGER